jgi:hypothetical protein
VAFASTGCSRERAGFWAKPTLNLKSALFALPGLTIKLCATTGGASAWNAAGNLTPTGVITIKCFLSHSAVKLGALHNRSDCAARRLGWVVSSVPPLRREVPSDFLVYRTARDGSHVLTSQRQGNRGFHLNRPLRKYSLTVGARNRYPPAITAHMESNSRSIVELESSQARMKHTAMGTKYRGRDHRVASMNR